MTRPRPLPAALVAAALALVLATGVRAEAAELPTLSAAQVKQVERLVADAQALQEAGRYLDATLKLKQAVALYPAPEVRYNLAYVYERAGAFARARDEYAACLAGGVTGELAREAAEGQKRVAERLATGVLRLAVTPVGATVFVDGTPRGRAPLAPLTLGAGRHRVRVTAEGHEAQDTEAALAGADTVTLEIALAPLTVTAGADRERGERPPGERLFHLSLALSEGVLASGATGSRTSVGLELMPALRWSWFQLDLGLALGLESPVTFFLRPGLRAFVGPVYVRAAAGYLAADGAQSWGALFGLGGQVPLGNGWFLLVEADASLWPSGGATFVPIDFSVGAGYGF